LTNQILIHDNYELMHEEKIKNLGDQILKFEIDEEK